MSLWSGIKHTLGYDVPATHDEEAAQALAIRGPKVQQSQPVRDIPPAPPYLRGSPEEERRIKQRVIMKQRIKWQEESLEYERGFAFQKRHRTAKETALMIYVQWEINIEVETDFDDHSVDEDARRLRCPDLDPDTRRLYMLATLTTYILRAVMDSVPDPEPLRHGEDKPLSEITCCKGVLRAELFLRKLGLLDMDVEIRDMERKVQLEQRGQLPLEVVFTEHGWPLPLAYNWKRKLSWARKQRDLLVEGRLGFIIIGTRYWEEGPWDSNASSSGSEDEESETDD